MAQFPSEIRDDLLHKEFLRCRSVPSTPYCAELLDVQESLFNQFDHPVRPALYPLPTSGDEQNDHGIENAQALNNTPCRLPLIDIHPLIAPNGNRDSVAAQIGQACREDGFFYVLTIPKRDDAGGLEVKSRSGWIEAPSIPGAFLCNIGDMLDRMTGGRYRSTPHRVQSPTQRDRLSFPFFFDPNFSAEVQPIELGRQETTKTSAGIGLVYTRSPGPTASTCSPRYPKSSRSYGGRY